MVIPNEPQVGDERPEVSPAGKRRRLDQQARQFALAFDVWVDVPRERLEVL